ncbi:MAG: sigma-70 family RNA polymerase sigma factor [Pseudolysinimonas sp.]
MSASPSEADLLSRARAGDQRAFSALIEPNQRKLWAACLRITANSTDAEDALQDALIAIWQSIDKFRGESSFGTWCFRVASNAALAVVRRRAYTSELPEDLPEDDRPDFTETFADRDRIQTALQTIPEDFRVALVLREFGDFSYQEIADHQGILVDTVKTRIYRARIALREALATT